MNIRPATAQDAETIVAFWNPLIREAAVTFNPNEKTAAEVAGMIRDRAAAGHAFLVAEIDGTVTGFATYGQFRGGQGYAHTMEHTVILSPNAHGKGIGRALMAALEEHARVARVHSMIAGVSAENPNGIAFHKALGYTEVAVLPEVGKKFGRWMDLHLMQKIL